MQKTTIIILALLLNNVVNAQDYELLDSTKYIAQYTYTVQRDAQNTDDKTTYTMLLYLGDKVSKFEHMQAYIRDSLRNKAKTAANQYTAYMDMFEKSASSETAGYLASFRIIKHLNSNHLFLSEKIVFCRQNIKVMEEPVFNWQLINSSPEVLQGYTCNKASLLFKGRTYTAWYTPEIPISDGPYKFKGLPGLIVKIEDTQHQHCFVLNKFTKTAYHIPIYTQAQNYTSVTMTEYYKIKRTDNAKMIELFNNPEKFQTNADMGEVISKINKRNNFIEKL
nr:GLPGLI family protein [uncultured Carboxylicivirga sp.]